ncbi:MAG: Xaa-Pro peptidase family protein [Candidatus Nanohaloarchaea archaeon]
MDFQSRADRVQEKMENNEIDYTILTKGSNLTYLSGIDAEHYEREFFLVVPRSSDPFFFLNELMEDEIREKSIWKSFEVWNDGDNPKKKLEKAVKTDASKVLIGDEMPARFTLELRRVFDEAEFELASDILDVLRLQKSEDEIEKLQRAADIADKTVEDVRSRTEEFIGNTEEKLAEFIESKMDEYGGEEPSFNTVVSSGPNGSKPHYEHGERLIKEGDPVVLDFGCYKEQYPSDQARTLVLGGEPSEKFGEVHETIKKAQQKAFEKANPGVKAKEVDRTARKVIENAGYGKEFIHRTGHGVGLSVHEPPFINQENDRKLEEGMVFSIEPGIYIEGEFGVRIEDLVVVTEEGCRRLNKTDRGWK